MTRTVFAELRGISNKNILRDLNHYNKKTNAYPCISLKLISATFLWMPHSHYYKYIHRLYILYISLIKTNKEYYNRYLSTLFSVRKAVTKYYTTLNITLLQIKHYLLLKHYLPFMVSKFGLGNSGTDSRNRRYTTDSPLYLSDIAVREK